MAKFKDIAVPALGTFLADFRESQRERQKQQQRVQELLLAGQLRRQEQENDPEFQAKRSALQAIEQATPFPQARLSASARPEDASRLQELFRGRMTERLGERAKLSEMFGLAPKHQPTTAETMAELQMLLNPSRQGASGETTGGFQPTAITRKGIRFEQSPEVEGERKAIQETISKEFQAASRLGGALRQISTVTSQFMEALPSEQRTELEQRFNGIASTIGARTGIAPNAQLLALLSNQRLQANELIKSFGEVGNLSQSDIQASIAAYNQAGLTDDERMAKLVQMAEWASSKISPRARRFLIKENPDLVQIFEDLGVDFLNPSTVVQRPSFDKSKGNNTKPSSGFRIISVE